MNITLAKSVIREATLQGVKVFCLCPGGRAAPFVELLSRQKNLEIFYFFEERSACFFALGRAKRENRPAAVVTTSGTAVAELLPGVIESYYSGFPLALITADRPFGQVEKGAPQTLKNPLQILSDYTACSVNISKTEDLRAVRGWKPNQGSLHLNVAFDEPLLDEPLSGAKFSARQPTPEIYPSLFKSAKPAPDILQPATPEKTTSGQTQRSAHNSNHDLKPLENFSDRIDTSENPNTQIEAFFNLSEKPLILAGELREIEAAAVRPLLKQTDAAVFTEPLSRISEARRRLASGEYILLEGLKTKAMDGVIRLGGVPRARFWRDLEKTTFPVLNLSSPPFYPGLERKSFNMPLMEALPLLAPRLQGLKPDIERFMSKDKERAEEKIRIFKKYPLSEPSWMRRFSRALPPEAEIFLGNSLPVRMWDTAASNTTQNITGQAGVNGIEGLVSRFLGECEPDKENWAFIGDLSALYDMPGFWISPQTPLCTLVVINNFGGRIFADLFSNPAYLNQHALSFAPLAKMWGLDYELYFDPEKFRFTPTRRRRLIEIRPDQEETNQCLKAVRALFRNRPDTQRRL